MVLHFSYYTLNDLPVDVICDIAIYADDTTLYSKCDRYLICGNNLNWLLKLNLIYERVWTEVRSGLLISGGLLVILIDWMIFVSPFLDVARISMSTVSFLAQLNSGILCL